MRSLSLSIIAAVAFAGTTAFAQMGQGSGTRGSYTAPSRGTISSTGSGGGSYNSAPSRGTIYTDSKSSGNSGNSNSGTSGSSGSSTSAPTRNNSGSGSSDNGTSGSSNSNYNNNTYYNNNSYSGGYYGGGYYNNTGGYYNTGVGNSSTVGSSGSSTGTTKKATATNNSNASISPDQMRNYAKQDIRKALAQFDRSSQQYTVSGTTPSTVTGLGGTRMNINPADLVTADGQPIKGDINVELKELDSPEKMALARRSNHEQRRCAYFGWFILLRNDIGRATSTTGPRQNNGGANATNCKRPRYGSIHWRG
ncbi:MAG: hypothetical protein M0D57_19545 [Sphingobacteriales bacterium JAD_PAG50586_3]|nr:MAG: hypothetical protein M0D57_19545 [Sphingobacteriales bacterium JAD_PAG50586_3]